MAEEQLELFRLVPRNEGINKVEWSEGGIKKLQIQRFKRFKDFEVDFDRITLLVGPNSSGKTSILQAVRLFFWCIAKCSRQENHAYRFAKAVIPFSDFHLIPAHELREIAFQGTSPNSRIRGIVLNGLLGNGLTLSFRIYASYSTLMVIDPIDQPKDPISEQQISQINRPPLYIPGFFGVVTRELLAHDARLEELLNSGHHNEVLRNIFLRLSSSESRLSKLLNIMKDEFQIKEIDIPFSQKTTEFLKAEYSEPANRVPFDFVSAGSGFLQVLQIMAHSLQNPSPLLLLDEPDAHMHHSLQKSFINILKTFVNEEDLQVIMASHSETFLREISLAEIRVIDASNSKASKFPDEIELKENLLQAGIWPTHSELAEILRTKRVLIIEGKDVEVFLDHIGRLKYKDWDIKRKFMQVIYSEGSSDSIVKRLEYINKILFEIIPNGIKIAHMRDRDLLCDHAIQDLLEEARKKRLPLLISNRRNIESLLIEPSLVERTLQTKFRDSLPSELKADGNIMKCMKDKILDWCKQELDEIPVKVQEYNRAWIKNKYDRDNWREGEKIVTRFIRENWHDPIEKGLIPWKLVDGKSILHKILSFFQQYRIILSKKTILEIMKEDDFEECMKETVNITYNWI